MWLIEISLIVLILGTSGASVGYLIVNETGPFDILLKIRRSVGLTEDVQESLDMGEYEIYDQLSVLAKMFTCDTCTCTATTVIFSLINVIFPESIYLFSTFSCVSIALITKKFF